MRLELIYAAHPDAIAELRATADKLQDVPREWLESPQDMCHGLRRVAARLRQIADRIKVVEPTPAPSSRMQGRRPTPRVRASRHPEAQIEMAL